MVECSYAVSLVNYEVALYIYACFITIPNYNFMKSDYSHSPIITLHQTWIFKFNPSPSPLVPASAPFLKQPSVFQ